MDQQQSPFPQPLKDDLQAPLVALRKQLPVQVPCLSNSSWLPSQVEHKMSFLVLDFSQFNFDASGVIFPFLLDLGIP